MSELLNSIQIHANWLQAKLNVCEINSSNETLANIEKKL